MAEKTFPINVVGVDYTCDECGIGAMIPNGNISFLSDPPKFPHLCPNCGATAYLSEKYPSVRHLRADH